ncbi:hypothetical protein [Kitasatospora sp. NPDC047058]|uniref:hypothetical protein n=1 Tax=Kitasatospora sp. NPDC047058 TaxID=3155620 RepID=UPI0033DEDE3C
MPAYKLMHALALIDEDLNDRRMEALGTLPAARALDTPAPLPVQAAAEPTAQPFVTILRTSPGEITASGYNAGALRILLTAGFEEVSLRSHSSWLRLPSNGNLDGPDERACSAASELLAAGHPVRLDRTLGQPVGADGKALPGTPSPVGEMTSRAEAARTAPAQSGAAGRGPGEPAQASPASGPTPPPRSR